MKRYVIAIAALLAACDSAGPTAPDSWLRVATKHGTVALQPGVDPARAVRHIEAGFARGTSGEKESEEPRKT
jgi:hypothetical protein